MITKQFVTAGRAIFTIKSVTGEYYTYRVKKVITDHGRALWFVALLTGPDNTSSYTYLGQLNDNDGTVRLTKASHYTDDTLPVKVIRWALRLVWRDAPVPDGYRFHHVGRCGRCGRELTVPESIESGFGPECIHKIGIPQLSQGEPQ